MAVREGGDSKFHKRVLNDLVAAASDLEKDGKLTAVLGLDQLSAVTALEKEHAFVLPERRKNL